jgi:hypothetical protein
MFKQSSTSSFTPLQANIARTFLRNFIKSIDYKGYGLSPETIGTHSIRSSAAMAMYLNGVPIATIMLLGRWSSDAVLRYIRKQVEEFGHDVSDRMLRVREFYHTVDPSHLDPRSHNPLSAAANSGMGYGRSIQRGAFAVWN